MIKQTLIRRSLAATAGSVAAVALLGAGAAQAAQSTPAAPQIASVTTFKLPKNGSWVVMPTNLFGNTKICAKNGGSNTGKLRVESTAFGLGLEFISGIAPGQTKCLSRAWVGVPVKLTNVSNTSLTVTGS